MPLYTLSHDFKMADEIVGKRVLSEGFRGEIKFVGPVPPTQG